MQTSLFPEWANTRAITLAWPFPESDWRNNLTQAQACYAEMIKAFSQVVQVWVLVHPSVDHLNVEGLLTKSGASMHQLQLITSIPYNDTWLRDYGPLSCGSGYIKFEFNGWGGKYAAPDDNRAALLLEDMLGQRVTSIPYVCEGGGLETNGEVLLVNEDCIVDEARNAGVSKQQMASVLKHHLQLDTIEWLSNVQLTGDDTDGHIDTIARFVGNNVLVYTGINTDHPDVAALQSLDKQLKEIAHRHNWQLLALPTPVYRSLLDGRVLPATYANFLICNAHIFLPIYGVEEDARAIELMAANCPGFKVIPVRCEALLEQHGSLHCATMQIIDLQNPMGN